MGITRDKEHKRRATGGKRKEWRKHRKFLLGRPSALTKIGSRIVHRVRTRGGNRKFRALKLDTGSFSWGSENLSRKTRILTVVYSASNNEYVRTNTLVKNSIVQIDASPFVKYYEQRYGVALSKKKKGEAEAAKSKTLEEKQKAMRTAAPLDAHLEEQLKIGRLYASISSRPGQSGKADGYILEGKELEFYTKKMSKKKEGKTKA